MFGNLHHKLFAAIYDPVQAAGERTWLGAARADLLGDIGGTVAEIGGGTGANLPHYRRADRVVIGEPDDEMRARLSDKLGRARVPVEMSANPADAIDAPDDSFDAVVSTLVLCTVPDPSAVFAEARRVLRPGGRLYFLEHVRGDDGSVIRRKERIDPFWSWLSLGCHVTRDTVGMLESEGWTVEVRREFGPSKLPAFLKPFVLGVATPPSTEVSS
ncbi:MAG: class I SAM-dependent methyltransferase [Acidimicrobiia bacterium]